MFVPLPTNLEFVALTTTSSLALLLDNAAESYPKIENFLHCRRTDIYQLSVTVASTKGTRLSCGELRKGLGSLIRR